MSHYRTSRKYFLEAVKLAFQPTGDPEVDSPSIIIEPQESLIQGAVNFLISKDPNYFKGVRKIVSKDSANYGYVEFGPGKDDKVININFPRIKRELEQKSNGVSQENLKQEIIKHISSVIAHERAHVFNPDGGEPLAEQAEKEMLKSF